MELAASAAAISSCKGSRRIRTAKRPLSALLSAAAAASAARHSAALHCGPSCPKPLSSAAAMRSRTVLRARPSLRAIWRTPRPARQCTKISMSSSTVILLRPISHLLAGGRLAGPNSGRRRVGHIRERVGHIRERDRRGWVISVNADSGAAVVRVVKLARAATSDCRPSGTDDRARSIGPFGAPNIHLLALISSRFRARPGRPVHQPSLAGRAQLKEKADGQ
jgi:hypothetical protein